MTERMPRLDERLRSNSGSLNTAGQLLQNGTANDCCLATLRGKGHQNVYAIP